KKGWEATMTREPLLSAPCLSKGFDVLGHQLQVLRNQRVGRTCNEASSGPRLDMLIWMSMSSAVSLAYSTKTSKYRSSLKTPVSSSSYSKSFRLRFLFVLTRS